MSRSRVLVVDDNEHNREYARQVLADHYEVEVAEDGFQALVSVRTARPDLVVLDLSMPRLDGWEVIQELRQDPGTKEIPVLACSAHAMRGDQERALAAGFDGYVTKPYRAAELVSYVELFLGRGSAPASVDSEADDWGGADWSLGEDDWSEKEGAR